MSDFVCTKCSMLSKLRAVTVKTQEPFLPPGALLTPLSAIHFHLHSLIFSHATCLIMDSSFNFDVPRFCHLLSKALCVFVGFRKAELSVECVYKGLPCNLNYSEKECEINLCESAATFITLSLPSFPQSFHPG